MKFLKKKLGDGNSYTFSTLSITEQRALRAQYSKFQDLEKEINQIQFEINPDKSLKKDEFGDVIPRTNLTVEENKRIQELQDETLDFMLNIVLKSICKNHKDFVLTGDKEKDAQIRNKLADIIDVQDLRNLAYFVFNGTYSLQKEVIIDTGEGEVEEKKV